MGQPAILPQITRSTCKIKRKISEFQIGSITKRPTPRFTRVLLKILVKVPKWPWLEFWIHFLILESSSTKVKTISLSIHPELWLILTLLSGKISKNGKPHLKRCGVSLEAAISAGRKVTETWTSFLLETQVILCQLISLVPHGRW